MSDRIGISFAMPPLRAGARLSLRQKRIGDPGSSGWYVVEFAIGTDGRAAWAGGDAAQSLTHDRAQLFVDRRFCGERAPAW